MHVGTRGVGDIDGIAGSSQRDAVLDNPCWISAVRCIDLSGDSEAAGAQHLLEP